jgi:virginiamycin B lyase
VWFPESCPGEAHISEMATLGAAAGTIEEHTLGTSPTRMPTTIAIGADGNIWFADYFRASVIRLNASTDEFDEFFVPGARPAELADVILGPDNKIWVSFNDTIGRITVDGDIDEFELPDNGDAINFMTLAPDGSVWATEFDGTLRHIVTTTSGISSTLYPVRHGSGLTSITPGPGRKLWFTENLSNIIGSIFSDAIFFDGMGDDP